MLDRDKWMEVFQVLGKNPFRTAATAFGVMWGILMLIIMMGAGTGLENGVKANFSKTTNCMFVWSQTTSKPHGGFKQGRRPELTLQDVQSLKAAIPEMDLISPRNQLGGYRGTNNTTRGLRTGVFQIYGDTPSQWLIVPRPIVAGRFINQSDMDEQRKVCVIGTRVVNELFEAGEDPIGEYIKIKGINFQVVGVYRTNRTGEQAEEETKNIFIPFSTFQKAFNYGDRVGWFSITAKDGYLVSDLESKVLQHLKIRHRVHPDDNRAFGYYNSQKEYMQMNGVFSGIRFLAWFVGVLTLVAGVIGVSNIMLVIVKERTREIGVRKALGATPWNIVSQVLMEALLLAGVAGASGVILGVWAMEGLNTALAGTEGGNFKNPGVDFQVVLSALLILVVCGTLAGLIPAIRAVQVKPVEALKDE
jgi:putative ABC transport system permease protein